jgi:ABC-type branched-subunit amino acid transport system ATPase component
MDQPATMSGAPLADAELPSLDDTDIAVVDRPEASADPSAALEAIDVTVRFGGLVALNKVSIRVAPGEILGIVGPNGAGKTTLFGALSGLTRPVAGDVYLAGDRVTTLAPQDRARRGLARTFQRVQLFPELTVREHLVLAYRMRRPHPGFVRSLVGPGRPRHDTDEIERVDQLLEDLGLMPVRDAQAVALPLGTARLVEVGRALAFGPSVLLLDEPSSGLDSHETEQVARMLTDVRDREGISLLFVEHDFELVLRLSDRVDVLDFGTKIASGRPAEIRANKDVLDAYVGTTREL